MTQARRVYCLICGKGLRRQIDNDYGIELVEFMAAHVTETESIHNQFSIEAYP